jgi:hypothetical protein
MGRNHTRLPPLSKIIGPNCPGPRNGDANRKPGALAALAGCDTVTNGGCSEGSETKLCDCAGVPGLAVNSISGITAGCATVKESVSVWVRPFA